MYAIARIDKIKGLGHLKKAGNHNMRSVNVQNADASKPDGAVVLHGSDDPAGDVIARLPVDGNGEIKVRKNAVWAVEHLLTASPEYFRPDNPEAAGEYDEERMQAWKECAMRFLRDKYGDNLAHAVLHLDEATPHIQALVVPRRDDGKLDAAKLFGPEQLRRMQTEYHEYTADLGLQRGISGSKAKHNTLKRYYGRVNSQTADLPQVITPAPAALPNATLAERIPFTSAHAQRVSQEQANEKQGRKRSKEVRERNRAALKQYPVVAAKAAKADDMAKAERAREKALERLRDRANEIREIPLAAVFERFDCKADRRDKHNVDSPAGRISVEGQKWYNHDLHMGGKGAIDLVMHLGNWNYTDAIAWLGAELGTDAAVSAALARTRDIATTQARGRVKSAVPEPSAAPEAVQRVREYLTNKRGLEPNLVDSVMRQGYVFPVVHQAKDREFVNVGFKLSGGKGVELRGVAGSYHGARGEKGLFVIAPKGATKTVFVESAIEALSYYQLADARGESVKVISTTGSSRDRLQKAVQTEIDNGMTVVPAFNADKAGQSLAAAVTAMGGEKHEIPPYGLNDWNDWLLRKPEIERIEAEQRQAERDAEVAKSMQRPDHDQDQGMSL